jgi:hypothetical protein
MQIQSQIARTFYPFVWQPLPTLAAAEMHGA